jgi:hypothetical protein
MRTLKNSETYTAGTLALAMMAGWIASTPQRRALEALADEMADVQERDFAARVTFQRRASNG